VASDLHRKERTRGRLVTPIRRFLMQTHSSVSRSNLRCSWSDRRARHSRSLVSQLRTTRSGSRVPKRSEQTRSAGTIRPLSDEIVHYELSGSEDGPPVVLVNGFSVPYYLWDPTVPSLVHAGFRVLRYDIFGRGLSDRPDKTYDSDLFDRQMLELVSQQQISRPAHLIASSMGGPIAVTFAARHPERVGRIVLIGPGYFRAASCRCDWRCPYSGSTRWRCQLRLDLPPHKPQTFFNLRATPST